MSNNIMIPACLFDNILEAFNILEPFLTHDLRNEVVHIVWELNMKKHKMELRDAYSKIVAAKNTADRDWARIEYLRLKNQSVDPYGGL
jgi:hypothetical protein